MTHDALPEPALRRLRPDFQLHDSRCRARRAWSLELQVLPEEPEAARTGESGRPPHGAVPASTRWACGRAPAASMTYEEALSSPHWCELKSSIRRRCGGLCEWCSRRPMAHLHHRTYARLGHELASDVMAVCEACHWNIHGWLQSIVVEPNSLADQGDPGMGDSELWDTYLRTLKEDRAKARLRNAYMRSAIGSRKLP